MKTITPIPCEANAMHTLAKLAKGAGLAAMSLALMNCATPPANTAADQRSAIPSMTRQTLNELYATQSGSRQLIASCAGYAVFNPIKPKPVSVGTDYVYGLAVDRSTGRETYMRMAGLSDRYGAGLANCRAVIIFRDSTLFHAFVSRGWSMVADSQSVAALDRASTHDGTVVSSNMDPVVYHLSRNGVAVSATLGARKVWPEGAQGP